ncbi:uncharacterized protein LOC110706808 isoform X2 [Chenopodium quinoa]|uniref:uncharacterized protein LOC110706808 isoform X2 n=1 Tax=Chenopodium quinoa TaxID=63459 RepID=UPI000B77D494|nr:uncharacterized protein LOC110706808 isoform X2 [Chenopodium quinoa]
MSKHLPDYHEKVMELEPRKISISYCSLLKQVLDHLQFPPPVYELVDITKNHVKLHVETTDLGFSHTYTFDGGKGEKLQASSEKAAEDAVRHLRAEFDLCIHDWTSTKIWMYKRCELLFQLKHDASESK